MHSLPVFPAHIPRLRGKISFEVIEMKEYQGLGDMLKNNQEAFSYYTSLPKYVRSMIAMRSDNIHTFDTLQNYADNLLSGDG